MVTGFIRLNGRTVGVVANSLCSYGEDGTAGEEYAPEITADGAEKAADFISFCDAFDLPVLTIVQSEGFAASLEEEKALPRALARLVSTLSAATVAKVSLLVGKAYGSAAVMMNAKAIGADLVYALPDAQLGMMDAKLASQIMYAGEPKAVQDEKAKEYEALQSNIVSAARRGYVDALVEPVNARKYLIDAFELLATKRQEISSRKHITK
jgi:acetyl-CoA carboxylase carboxyltransferase component